MVKATEPFPSLCGVKGFFLLYLGAKETEPVLLIHGEPSWSDLYRKMIPIFVQAGYRAVAPDLVGFSRSDKPADRKDYTYQRHVDWMQNWPG